MKLNHTYPQMMPPEDEPTAPIDDYREVWAGSMRLVRSRKRRRVLQRRGVPMMDTGERTTGGKKVWAWFVELTD